MGAPAKKAVDDLVDFCKNTVQQSQQSCSDCKDGFYYPFVGPREPCQTCQGVLPSGDILLDFRTEVLNRLSVLEIPGVTIAPATQNRDNTHTLEGSLTDLQLHGLIPSPALFAENFCDGMKAELINHVAGCRNIKLQFDYSTLEINYNAGCTYMKMEFYLELL